jgi:hypothetical protein
MNEPPELDDLTIRLRLLERLGTGPEALGCRPGTVHAMRPVSFAFSSHGLAFLRWCSSNRRLLGRIASMVETDHTGRIVSGLRSKGSMWAG